MYRKYFKYILDLLISVIVLVILFPILIVVLIVLTITNSGSPFFLQTRPGENGLCFKIIKFKTMNDRRDENGILLPDSMRLTRVGKFIRITSLDEIPQLINVIKGEMSLVGPRPLLVSYLPLYNKTQNRRHEVKPGITGWAQINGRNAISWSQKFVLDVWYVDNISFMLDVKIIIRTIKKVFQAKGISEKGHATMNHFGGN